MRWSLPVRQVHWRLPGQVPSRRLPTRELVLGLVHDTDHDLMCCDDKPARPGAQ